MTKILITEFIDSQSLQNINKKFDVIYKKDAWQNKDFLEKEIQKFDGIIVRNKTSLDKKILINASNLKFIGRLGVGLDNIDTEYCKNHNIHVQPATGMNADSVAEYVINAALTLLKNIPLMHQETLIGNWPRTSISSRELRGKTIGLLGFGLIAKKVSTLAKVFDAKIIAYDPYLDPSVGNQFDTKLLDINDVFRMSDVISIHLPLTENTKNLLNKNFQIKVYNQKI